jgi:V/A-type H+-transporting ATPase subunit F
MKIAIIADEDTVNCFKLGGLEYAYSVNSPKEAGKRIREFLEKPDFSVIITTDHIADRIRATINEITEERKYPLIVSIPNVGVPSPVLLDPITELIKRKTGIELKL